PARREPELFAGLPGMRQGLGSSPGPGRTGVAGVAVTCRASARRHLRARAQPRLERAGDPRPRSRAPRRLPPAWGDLRPSMLDFLRLLAPRHADALQPVSPLHRPGAPVADETVQAAAMDAAHLDDA